MSPMMGLLTDKDKLQKLFEDYDNFKSSGGDFEVDPNGSISLIGGIRLQEQAKKLRDDFHSSDEKLRSGIYKYLKSRNPEKFKPKELPQIQSKKKPALPQIEEPKIEKPTLPQIPSPVEDPRKKKIREAGYQESYLDRHKAAAVDLGRKTGLLMRSAGVGAGEFVASALDPAIGDKSKADFTLDGVDYNQYGRRIGAGLNNEQVQGFKNWVRTFRGKDTSEADEWFSLIGNALGNVAGMMATIALVRKGPIPAVRLGGLWGSKALDQIGKVITKNNKDGPNILKRLYKQFVNIDIPAVLVTSSAGVGREEESIRFYETQPGKKKGDFDKDFPILAPLLDIVFTPSTLAKTIGAGSGVVEMAVPYMLRLGRVNRATDGVLFNLLGKIPQKSGGNWLRSFGHLGDSGFEEWMMGGIAQGGETWLKKKWLDIGKAEKGLIELTKDQLFSKEGGAEGIAGVIFAMLQLKRISAVQKYYDVANEVSKDLKNNPIKDPITGKDIPPEEWTNFWAKGSALFSSDAQIFVDALGKGDPKLGRELLTKGFTAFFSEPWIDPSTGELVREQKFTPESLMLMMENGKAMQEKYKRGVGGFSTLADEGQMIVNLAKNPLSKHLYRWLQEKDPIFKTGEPFTGSQDQLLRVKTLSDRALLHKKKNPVVVEILRDSHKGQLVKDKTNFETKITSIDADKTVIREGIKETELSIAEIDLKEENIKKSIPVPIKPSKERIGAKATKIKEVQKQEGVVEGFKVDKGFWRMGGKPTGVAQKLKEGKIEAPQFLKEQYPLAVTHQKEAALAEQSSHYVFRTWKSRTGLPKKTKVQKAILATYYKRESDIFSLEEKLKTPVLNLELAKEELNDVTKEYTKAQKNFKDSGGKNIEQRKTVANLRTKKNSKTKKVSNLEDSVKYLQVDLTKLKESDVNDKDKGTQNAIYNEMKKAISSQRGKDISTTTEQGELRTQEVKLIKLRGELKGIEDVVKKQAKEYFAGIEAQSIFQKAKKPVSLSEADKKRRTILKKKRTRAYGKISEKETAKLEVQNQLAGINKAIIGMPNVTLDYYDAAGNIPEDFASLRKGYADDPAHEVLLEQFINLYNLWNAKKVPLKDSEYSSTGHVLPEVTDPVRKHLLKVRNESRLFKYAPGLEDKMREGDKVVARGKSIIDEYNRLQEELIVLKMLLNPGRSDPRSTQYWGDRLRRPITPILKQIINRMSKGWGDTPQSLKEILEDPQALELPNGRYTFDQIHGLFSLGSKQYTEHRPNLYDQIDGLIKDKEDRVAHLWNDGKQRGDVNQEFSDPTIAGLRGDKRFDAEFIFSEFKYAVNKLDYSNPLKRGEFLYGIRIAEDGRPVIPKRIKKAREGFGNLVVLPESTKAVWSFTALGEKEVKDSIRANILKGDGLYKSLFKEETLLTDDEVESEVAFAWSSIVQGEQRLQDGAQQEKKKLLDLIIDNLKSPQWKREFNIQKFLPKKIAEWADARNMLWNLVKMRQSQGGTVARLIHHVNQGLTSEQVELLARYTIVLDEYYSTSVKNNQASIFGVAALDTNQISTSLHAVHYAHQQLDKEIKKDPIVFEAWKRQADVRAGLINDYKRAQHRLDPRQDLSHLDNPAYFPSYINGEKHANLSVMDLMEDVGLRQPGEVKKRKGGNVRDLSWYDVNLRFYQTMIHHTQMTNWWKEMLDRYGKKIMVKSVAEKKVRGIFIDFENMDYAPGEKPREGLAAGEKIGALQGQQTFTGVFNRLDGSLTSIQSEVGMLEEKGVPPSQSGYLPFKGIVSGLQGTMFTDPATEKAKKQAEALNGEPQSEPMSTRDGMVWLPKNIIEAINGMKPREGKSTAIGNLWRNSTLYWKIYQLLAPQRFVPHNVRNAISDIDVVLPINPDTFRYVKQSTKELYEYYYKDRSPQDISPDLSFFMRYQGPETLGYAELNRAGDQKVFLRIMQDPNLEAKLSGSGNRAGIFKQTGKDVASAWNGYWGGAIKLRDYREQILRYASYLSYIRQIENSEDGRTPGNWGASQQAEVWGLTDIRDKAYLLSNDLLGNYDRLGGTARKIRENWMPFFSWKVANWTRTSGIIRNLMHPTSFNGQKNNIKEGEKVYNAFSRYSKGIGFMGYRAALVPTRWAARYLGSIFMLGGGLKIVADGWNDYFLSEEENEEYNKLPGTKGMIEFVHGVRRQKNGEFIFKTFSNVGSFEDIYRDLGAWTMPWTIFSSLVNMNPNSNSKINLQDALSKAVREQTTIGSLINFLGSDTTQTALGNWISREERISAGSIHPFHKAVYELGFSGRSLFGGGKIRDNYLHLLQGIGLDDLWKGTSFSKHRFEPFSGKYPYTEGDFPRGEAPKKVYETGIPDLKDVGWIGRVLGIEEGSLGAGVIRQFMIGSEMGMDKKTLIEYDSYLKREGWLKEVSATSGVNSYITDDSKRHIWNALEVLNLGGKNSGEEAFGHIVMFLATSYLARGPAGESSKRDQLHMALLGYQDPRFKGWKALSPSEKEELLHKKSIAANKQWEEMVKEFTGLIHGTLMEAHPDVRAMRRRRDKDAVKRWIIQEERDKSGFVDYGKKDRVYKPLPLKTFTKFLFEQRLTSETPKSDNKNIPLSDGERLRELAIEVWERQTERAKTFLLNPEKEVLARAWMEARRDFDPLTPEIELRKRLDKKGLFP